MQLISGCPHQPVFRTSLSPPQGLKRVEAGTLDENDQILTVCRVKFSKKTTLLGKGYQWGHTLNGVHVTENCWVVAPNGTEVYVTAQDKVFYLQTRYDNVIAWANITHFPGFPDISPSPIFSRMGSGPNSTKQYVGRCRYEDEGQIHLLPGAINEDDVATLVTTFNGAVIKCKTFEVPVCI